MTAQQICTTWSKPAAEINKLHKEAMKAASVTLETFRQIGQKLLEAKNEVQHGEFEAWIEQNCDFSVRSARGYMRLAKGWDELSSKQLVSIGLEDALSALRNGGKDSNRQSLAVLPRANSQQVSKEVAESGSMGEGLANSPDLLLEMEEPPLDDQTDQIERRFRSCQRLYGELENELRPLLKELQSNQLTECYDRLRISYRDFSATREAFQHQSRSA